jgi:hypothetical protein
MLIITHAVTGAVVGQIVRSSPLAFIISVVLHFIMDMVPHGDSSDYAKYKETGKVPKSQTFQLFFDSLVVIGFTVYILAFRIEASWWPTFWGILGGVLPDMLVGVHECRPNKATKLSHQVHFYFHDIIIKRWKDIRFRYAVVLQILAIILAMNFLL